MDRASRGRLSQASGVGAEEAACTALVGEGWTVLGRRLRTEAGEVDVAAEKDGLLAIIEVKHRQTLAGAAHALTRRQQMRLLAAAEILLAENPGWGQAGVRFDVVLVDHMGAARRIADAFRLE
jgi:putative endonuclease